MPQRKRRRIELRPCAIPPKAMPKPVPKPSADANTHARARCPPPKVMPKPAPTPSADANAHASARPPSKAMPNDAGRDVLNPVNTVVLHGLCDMRTIDLLDWPTFYEDMVKDVVKECRKYGVIERAWADREVVDASVWLCFGTAEEAQLCMQKMGNRIFAGRRVTCKLHTASSWQGTAGIL